MEWNSLVYLDAAATSYPKPVSVRRAVAGALSTFGANPGRGGYAMSSKTAEAVYSVREQVADLFGGCSANSVVFTPNCTFALNLAIKGLVREGMRVLISDVEHNSVYRPLKKLEAEGRVQLNYFETVEADFDTTFDNFLGEAQKGVDLVVTTHSSNVTGAVLPVRKIANWCKFHSVLLVVDCAQTAGLLPVDMDWGISCLCTAGHKGLLGPMGTGVLVVGQGVKLNTLVEGGTGSGSISWSQPGFLPDRFESGTLNVPGIVGLGEGIRFLKSQKDVYKGELQKARKLYLELSKLEGVKLYTKCPSVDTHTPVVPFNFGDLDSETVSEYFAKLGIATRAGLHCAPLTHQKLGTLKTGVVRLSPSFFTSWRDIDCAICTLKKCKNNFY